MKQINGFTVIAHRPYGNTVPSEGFVILAVKHSDFGYEYVTAVVGTLDDREWCWGHYYPGTADVALASAVADYNER
jgi:hypothetical protein